MAKSSAPKRTTSLPSSLRKELEDLGQLAPLKIKSKGNRKEKRKAVRNDGKQARAEHFANKNKRKAEVVEEDESEEVEVEPVKKKNKVVVIEKSVVTTPPPIKHQTPLEKLLAKQEALTQSPAVANTKGKKKSQLESTEDLEIAWLEAKLGVRNGNPKDKEANGKWKNEYEEDGLDDLFEGIDELESATFGESTKNYKNLIKSTLEEEGSDDSEESDSEESEEEYGISDEELMRPDNDDDDDDADSEEEEGGMTASFGGEDFDDLDVYASSSKKGKGKNKSNLESSSEGDEESESESEDNSEDGDSDDSEDEMDEDGLDSDLDPEDPWAGFGSGDEEEEGGMTMTFGGDDFTKVESEVEEKGKKSKGKGKEKKGVTWDLPKEVVASTSTLAVTAPTKYIPPHLRQSSATSSATSSIVSPFPTESTIATTTPSSSPNAPPEDPRLKRQILGHLNKLSSTNMSALLPPILAFYTSHPRALVSTTLTSLLMNIVGIDSSLGEVFIITYAALVAAIGRNIGVEFMAGVVGRCCSLFDEAREKSKSGKDVGEGGFEGKPGNKEAENLVAFLAELYNFGVISCVLIYDLVRVFIESEGEGKGLGELEVELLVKVVKRAGQRLRQDDPSSLKEIIGLVKVKMAGANPSTMNLRTRFMLDALTNLKNNKIKPNADGAVDNYSNLKKFLSGLKKGSGSVPEPLRLTLSDIRSSSSKGKWWVVGAAWGGDPLVDSASKLGSLIGGKQVESDEVLAKLARKQGMNTDIRKGVFHVLMSSEDYVDACERLLQLGLTDVQQREIARVLLQCSGNEKSYNPYYTLVAHRMGSQSHSFQITLQYCLWDFLRELGEKTVGGEELVKTITDDGAAVKKVSSRKVTNLAKLYAWCVAKDVLTLAILKPVPFNRPKPQTIIFLQQFFTSLILSTQSTSPALIINTQTTRKDREALEMVFIKATGFPNLARGLVHFLDEFMESASGRKEEALIKWGTKVALETCR